MEKRGHWAWCGLALYALAWIGQPASKPAEETVQPHSVEALEVQTDLIERK